MGIGSTILGQGAGIWAENRQQNRQRDLMGLQQQHQMALNQQGHDLQMDMWNKTNYKAQVAHMKAAGLNPALMYKGSGPGGTTGSQGGGSAASGSAPKSNVMDVQNLLMGAQKANIDADTRLKNIEADKKAGPDTKLVTEQGIATRLGNNITENSTKAQIDKFSADLEKTVEDTVATMLQNQVDMRTIDEKVGILVQEEVNKALENYVGVKTADTRIEKIITETAREIVNLKDDTARVAIAEAEKRLADIDLFKGDRVDKRFIFKLIDGLKNGMKVQIENAKKRYKRDTQR